MATLTPFRPNRSNIFPFSLSLPSRQRTKSNHKINKDHHEDIVLSSPRGLVPVRFGDTVRKKRQSGIIKADTVKGNGGFGDYSAAGEFEVWGDEQRTTDGDNRQIIVGPGAPRAHLQTQSRCNDANASSLRPLLHVTHCELHSPREAELLRLDQLESLDRKNVERDPYSMMDNFHSPVPPPLPRRHGR